MIHGNHPKDYIHRRISYEIRPGYVVLDNVADLIQAEYQPYVLPEKQPTPDVILRTNILPQRRTHLPL